MARLEQAITGIPAGDQTPVTVMPGDGGKTLYFDVRILEVGPPTSEILGPA